jgi:PadR family transcriptional regulator
MSLTPALSEFEQLVLLAVTRVGDVAYGMAVRDEIAHRTGRLPSLAAVYATLARLEGRGLVSSWTAPPSSRRGGRATKHFQLEKAGAEALYAAQVRLQSMWEGVELTEYLEGG